MGEDATRVTTTLGTPTRVVHGGNPQDHTRSATRWLMNSRLYNNHSLNFHQKTLTKLYWEVLSPFAIALLHLHRHWCRSYARPTHRWTD
ncbi:MAG: hypothetical protein RMY28_030330 [Nostoc sp. ChiSLP01]|nr:hypothetical protein [Nostoc sp. CmiSLP01]MDZ8283603.1 hypothetical protein [Nostoc sp. ChiSLP01]